MSGAFDQYLVLGPQRRQQYGGFNPFAQRQGVDQLTGINRYDNQLAALRALDTEVLSTGRDITEADMVNVLVAGSSDQARLREWFALPESQRKTWGALAKFSRDPGFRKQVSRVERHLQALRAAAAPAQLAAPAGSSGPLNSREGSDAVVGRPRHLQGAFNRYLQLSPQERQQLDFVSYARGHGIENLSGVAAFDNLLAALRVLDAEVLRTPGRSITETDIVGVLTAGSSTYQAQLRKWYAIPEAERRTTGAMGRFIQEYGLPETFRYSVRPVEERLRAIRPGLQSSAATPAPTGAASSVPHSIADDDPAEMESAQGPLGAAFHRYLLLESQQRQQQDFELYALRQGVPRNSLHGVAMFDRQLNALAALDREALNTPGRSITESDLIGVMVAGSIYQAQLKEWFALPNRERKGGGAEVKISREKDVPEQSFRKLVSRVEHRLQALRATAHAAAVPAPTPAVADRSTPASMADDDVELLDFQAATRVPIKREPMASGDTSRSGSVSPPAWPSADRSRSGSPVVATVKQESAMPPRHEYNNAAPILQGADGRDVLIDGLQAGRGPRIDNLGQLIDQQKITKWTPNLLKQMEESLPPDLREYQRKAQLNRLKQQMTEASRDWLRLGPAEREAQLDSLMRVVEVPEIGGRGVIAHRALPEFTVLGPYAGRVIDERGEGESSVAHEFRTYGRMNVESYTFDTQARTRLISGFRAGNVTSMLNEANHPQDINVDVVRLGRNLNFFVTTRPVREGEALLLNYGTEYVRVGWESQPMEIGSDSESESSSGSDERAGPSDQPVAGPSRGDRSRSASPLAAQVKEEGATWPFPPHTYDNAAPILQGPDGEDILLDALQPSASKGKGAAKGKGPAPKGQPSAHIEDRNRLIDQQRVSDWSDVARHMDFLLPADISVSDQNSWIKALKERVAEESRNWLRLSAGERAQRLDSTLQVVDAGPMGRGVVAHRDIEPFEVLGPYSGRLVHDEQEPTIASEMEKYGKANVESYLFSTRSGKRGVSAYGTGNVLSMINAGNRPEDNNVGVIRLGSNLNFYVALRPIRAGDDVLVNYGPTYEYRGWQSHPIEPDSDDD